MSKEEKMTKANVAVTPMLSWDFVAIGALAWREDGSSVPCELADGVELRAEPATKGKPMLVPDKPWELKSIAWTQVLFDQGRYRMWYGCGHAEEKLCYAQSEDGFIWTKPNLGLVEYAGSKDNNIVLAGPGSTHSSIFIDPSASAEARYKCMQFASWWQGEKGEILENEEGYRRLHAKNTAKPGEKILPVNIIGQMLGLHSPDGLRWTKLEKPILNEWHDTHNLAMYDDNKKKYIAYFRGFYGGRRAISRAETDDFAKWPSTEICHQALPEDGPNASLYSNCYTRYPGRRDIHLMFPAIYHQDTDSVDVEIAVSLDGKVWSRLLGQPIIAHGTNGQADEGFIYADPALLRFPDGKFRLIFHGGPNYHNEGYQPKLKDAKKGRSYYAWAQWPEDRLAGIYAKGDGHFTIPPQQCGSQMLANYRTEKDGWIKFELIDRTVWPPEQIPAIEGFRFDDMQPMTGDKQRGPVNWAEKNISELAGKDVAVRVRMHKATLFSTAMCDADSAATATKMRFPVL